MRGFRALNIVSAAQLPLECICKAQGKLYSHSHSQNEKIKDVNYQAMYKTTPSAQRVAPRPKAGTASYEHQLRT